MSLALKGSLAAVQFCCPAELPLNLNPAIAGSIFQRSPYAIGIIICCGKKNMSQMERSPSVKDNCCIHTGLSELTYLAYFK